MVPHGYQKIRAVKALTYARENFLPGQILVIDAETATRLIKSRHAEAVTPEPERELVRTSCPKCGSALEYPASPEQNERWVTCGNPACGHGWLR